jgi:hypothetical protein
VRELARSPELRTEFALRGRVHGPQTLRGLDRLLVWAEGSVDPSTWPRLLAVAWVAPPFLFVGLIGYFVLGWLPWWVVPAGVHVWVLRKIGPRAREAFAESVPGGPPLRGLVPQLELLSGQRWGDPALASIADRLGCGEGAALASLRRLSGLLDYVEGRRNVFLALERWRALHGGAARDWLEALGEWETLSALATLAHDHPDWAYPTFATDGAVELKGNALGHPLIPPSECVRNDVSVGPPGTFLFVTGSNMSGKSTLLRALGTNAVLAAAGAPVCAASLRLPPVRVYTSMRIEDSLEEGISLFMAELLRIKQVVEAAASTDGAGRPVLYLIDEILHGTNTAERRIAARGVVRHLLGSGAIGAVSSHDLTLAEAPEIESAAQAVHFREEVGSADDAGAVLTFDFKLREGVATTRNALKLLEAVGLGELGVEAEGHGTDLPTEA